MAVTIKDIAKATGLSVATVSKYINGETLREKNRIAIERAIREQGYTVNEYARGLKSNRSRTIGILIPELTNLFVARIIVRIEELLRASGYSVIVCDCHSQEKLECEAVRFLLGKMVDGIINMPVCRNGHHLKPAVEKGIPIILIDRSIPELMGQTCGVFVDNENAAYEATKLLLENGHRRIGIIVGPKDIYTSRRRLDGYRHGLEDYGVPFDEQMVAYSDYTVQGGYEGMFRLLERNSGMTAAFVTNYEMTLGAIIALNDRGIKVYQDLSFIGFDNLDLSLVMHPKLTIVSQPLEEIGTQAARIMLDQLATKEKRVNYYVSLPTSIQMGDSVKTIGQ